MRSRWSIVTLLLLLAAVWLPGCAAGNGPSVRPEDVVLKAKLIPSDVFACAPDVTWIVEVELDHLGPGPLQAGERAYLSEVNVFDGQGPLQPSDTGVGCDTAGDPEISFGNDGRTYTLAVQAAMKSGDLPTTYDVLKSSASGFTYLGTEFPVKVRYYISASSPPETIAVVYAHHEKSFGTDRSWTKIVYADQSAAGACRVPDGWAAVQTPVRPTAFDPANQEAVLVRGPDERIWQYPLDGSTRRPLSDRLYGAFSPSPDGRWIAARAAGGPEIWLLDRKLGEERPLSLQGEMIGDWRPTGDAFFYVSLAGEVGEYSLTAGTTRWWARPENIPIDYRQERTVIEIPGLPFAPTSPGRLSPDGTQLIFAGGGSHIATIFRLDMDTGRLYAYPGTETDGFAPFWHPDGGRVLFGTPGIRVLDIALGKVTELGDAYAVSYIADIRPDGQLLAVTGENCWGTGPMPPTVPAPLIPIYQAVPRHPGAAAHSCVAVDRCSFSVTDPTAEQVLDWYGAELEGLGWRGIHSPVPDALARRFTRGDEYLSISARSLERKTLVWLHLRKTPEVTVEEAIAIAGATHRTAGIKWVAEYVASFESDRYGVSHPVWVVEATFPRSSVTVWVDALTAEPFRIRQSDDL